MTENKDKRISIRVTVETYTTLARAASMVNKTISEFLREYLENITAEALAGQYAYARFENAGRDAVKLAEVIKKIKENASPEAQIKLAELDEDLETQRMLERKARLQELDE